MTSSHSPPTSCRTLFTKASTTELAGQQGTATGADYFTAIIALIHLVTTSAVESIASIANSDLVIRLILVAPVALLADKRVALMTSHLTLLCDAATVQTGVLISLCQAHGRSG